jgi:hypothetical protein
MVHDDVRFGYGRSEASGASESSAGAGVTLERYAAYTGLPIDFLKSINLKDTNYDFNPAVRIPYPDELDREVYHRYRVSLNGEPRFKSPPKHVAPNPIPYGLQVLGDAREAGHLWLPEGESDTQVLWFIDEPALGIPGVQSWAKFGREWSKLLHDIPLLLVPVEHDLGGERFWTLLSSTDEIRDRVRRVQVTSPELDDVKKFWKNAVEDGSEEEFKRAVKGHVYLQSRSFQP